MASTTPPAESGDGVDELSAPMVFSRAPITAKEDWVHLYNVLQPSAWSLPNPSESGDGSSGGGGSADARDTIASFTMGTQSLTAETVAKKVKEQSGGASFAVASGSGARIDSKKVYELSLNSLRLCDLGVKADEANQAPIIKASPLAPYSALRQLTVNNNKLTSAKVLGAVLPLLADLREIQVDFNQLDGLPSFAANQHLEFLSAAHNEMTSAGELVAPKLNTLTLASNRLRSMPSSTMRLPNLTQLNLSSNEMKSLESISSLTRLTTLDVSGNQLTSLAGIETLTALEDLNASRNLLRTSALSAHKNPLRALAAKLETLDVSDNRISTLGFFPSQGFPVLWKLSVAKNAFHGHRQQAAEGSKEDGDELNTSSKPGATKQPKGKGTVLSKTTKSGLAEGTKDRKEKKKKKRGTGSRLLDSSSSSDKDDDDDDLFDFSYDEDESVIFTAGDIGEGTYDEDDGAKATTKRTPQPKGNKEQKQQALPTGVRRRPSQASSANGATATKGSKGSKKGDEKAPERLGTPESEGSFMTRLAALIPNIEVLDLADNAPEVIPEYTELRVLAKLGNLTEIKLQGTLDMGKNKAKQHRDAVLAFLPNVEVVDGVLLEKKEKPTRLTDVDADAVNSRPTSAANGGPRPMSAAGLRAGSALLRHTTGGSAGAGGLAMQKQEVHKFRDELVAFLTEADKTKEKCEHVVDFLEANVEWAFEGSDLPDEEILTHGKGGKHIAEKEEAEALEELEEQLKREEAVAAMVSEEKKRQVVQQRTPNSRTHSQQGYHRSPSTPGGMQHAPQNTSPQAKRLLMRSHSESAVSHSRTKTPASASGRMVKLQSLGTLRREPVGEVPPDTMTRAMEKVQKDAKRMRPSFAQEQAKFKQQLRQESSERFAQLMHLTGADPSVAAEAGLLRNKKVAEAGKSKKISLAPKAGTKATRPSTSDGATSTTDHQEEKPVDVSSRVTTDEGQEQRGMLKRALMPSTPPVERISCGVGADEPHPTTTQARQALIPGLNLPQQQPGSSAYEVGRDDVEFHDDEEYFHGGDEDEDEEDMMIQVTGDPRFHTASTGSVPQTPTEAEGEERTPTASGGVGAGGKTASRKKEFSALDDEDKRELSSSVSELVRPSSASLSQRQEMGKSHKRLGQRESANVSANVTKLADRKSQTAKPSEGSEVEIASVPGASSTEVSFQSIVLKRYLPESSAAPLLKPKGPSANSIMPPASGDDSSSANKQLKVRHTVNLHGSGTGTGNNSNSAVTAADPNVLRPTKDPVTTNTGAVRVQPGAKKSSSGSNLNRRQR